MDLDEVMRMTSFLGWNDKLGPGLAYAELTQLITNS